MPEWVSWSTASGLFAACVIEEEDCMFIPCKPALSAMMSRITLAFSSSSWQFCFSMVLLYFFRVLMVTVASSTTLERASSVRSCSFHELVLPFVGDGLLERHNLGTSTTNIGLKRRKNSQESGIRRRALIIHLGIRVTLRPRDISLALHLPEVGSILLTLCDLLLELMQLVLERWTVSHLQSAEMKVDGVRRASGRIAGCLIIFFACDPSLCASIFLSSTTWASAAYSEGGKAKEYCCASITLLASMDSTRSPSYARPQAPSRCDGA
ncbi:hypothetical protein KC325_g272 [Hortaea werneckii]|nr:hypothetical protein KC325_g272 [Hortaea werneckii]